jgi:hypothetical protein
MKSKKVIFILFVALCVVTKIYFITKNNPDLRFNADDQRNYTIAQNYVLGKGYGIYNPMVHRYRLSAFHTSSTIFLYQFLIKRQVPQKAIVFVFYILSTILYVLAILYFYRILSLLNISRALIYSATAVFALYPSVLYAMGSIYHFDNLVMPLHVINFYFLLQWVKKRTLTLPVGIFLISSIVFCCFFRSQVLPLYFISGCLLLFIYIKDMGKTKRAGNTILYFLIALPLSICIAFIPVLIKNKKMFGAYIISKQTGFELLDGHNGLNGGNWEILTPGDPLDKYVHEKIPAVETLDEYAESKARKKLALDWIRNNPGKEIIYIFKKVARYFLPRNAPVVTKPVFKYHPITCLVHFLFLTTIIVCLFKDRTFLFSREMLLLLIPVATTILLSVVFFFNFKLRYNAEPFMIIIAGYGMDRYLKFRANNHTTIDNPLPVG